MEFNPISISPVQRLSAGRLARELVDNGSQPLQIAVTLTDYFQVIADVITKALHLQILLLQWRAEEPVK